MLHSLACKTRATEPIAYPLAELLNVAIISGSEKPATRWLPL